VFRVEKTRVVPTVLVDLQSYRGRLLPVSIRRFRVRIPGRTNFCLVGPTARRLTTNAMFSFWEDTIMCYSFYSMLLTNSSVIVGTGNLVLLALLS
jgi:hypothetical protein